MGLNAAQAKSDSVGVKEIEAFIEKDVPQVRETVWYDNVHACVLRTTISRLGMTTANIQ